MRQLLHLILITNSLYIFSVEQNLLQQDDFAKELSSYNFLLINMPKYQAKESFHIA